MLRPRPIVAGFTLVEVLISVVLALLLMVAVSAVFRTAGEAVGTGQAVAEGGREARAAQSVIYNDFRAAADPAEAPFFLIASRRIAAFRDAADRAIDLDYDPAGTAAERLAQTLTADLDGDGTEQALPAGLDSDRSHRADALAFFGQSLYRKQTGATATQFTQPLTAPSAYVWYGHVALPTRDAATVAANPTLDPGEGTPATNPDNFHAADWTLGRVVLMLTEATTDNAGAAVRSINTLSPTQDPNTTEHIRPASLDMRLYRLSKITPVGTNADHDLIEASRHDSVRATLFDTRQALRAFVTANPVSAAAPGAAATDWWSGLIYRFGADPFPKRPITADGAALLAPVFLGECTRFVVEYAGDYVSQDDADPAAATFGHVTDDRPDGTIDFLVVGARHRTRWYGLPRDADGDGIIPGIPPAATITTTVTNNQMADPVPLRDVIRSGGSNAALPNATRTRLVSSNGASFERLFAGTTDLLPPKADYAAAGAAGLGIGDRYVCAWGPSDGPPPTLVRLLVTLDDGRRRLSEGQTFEYVFEVGR